MVMVLKVRVVGEIDSWGPTAVPEMGRMAIPPGEAITCRLAVRRPTRIGVKRTVMLQDVPGASIAGQPLSVMANSLAFEPLSTGITLPTAIVPLFVTRKMPV